MSALMDALMFVGAVLDTPGSMVRNSMVGENPFKGLFEPEDRTYGRDVLEKWGILDENEEGFDWGDVAGFGVDVVADPLSILGLGKAAGGLGRMAGRYADEAVKGGETLGTGFGALGGAGRDLPLYSRAQEAAQNLPDTIKGQSLPNMLRRRAPEGVSDAELEALMLDELIGSPSVSRAQVAGHMGAQNPVSLKYGAGEYERYLAPQKRPHPVDVAQGFSQAPPPLNYQEALLAARNPQMRQLDEIVSPEDYWRLIEGDPAYANKIRELYGQPFKGSHFQDQRNIISHIRHTDRMTPEGERVLFADEIQSDWFQRPDLIAPKGPPQVNAKALEDVKNLRHEMDQLQNQYPGGGPGWLTDPAKRAQMDAWQEKASALESAYAQAKQNAIPQLQGKAYPHSPFKDEWQNMSLKYLLSKAAKEDYPLLGITRAETIQPVVGGRLSGQQAFYNDELIKRLDKILRKQLRFDERVAPGLLEDLGEQSLLRITPEMRKAILTKGLPLMGLGGASMSPLMRAMFEQGEMN